MQSKRIIKGAVHPKDLYALGTKPKSESDSKATAPQSSNLVSQLRKPGPPSVLPPKRDPGLGTSLLGAKKPRPGGQTFTPLGRQADSDYRGSPTTQIYLYEDIATEVEGHELVELIEEASGDDERVEALLCGAVKHLKTNRSKPDQLMYMSLIYLAKTRPALFQSEVVIEAFCSLLKRDISINFKAKGNALVSVLACNIFVTALQDMENWPDSFVKVYLDDCLGERIWVDRPECRAFVENIQTAFNTRLPRISIFASGEGGAKTDLPSGSSSPTHSNVVADDESHDAEKCPAKMDTSEEDLSGLVSKRYNGQQMSIEAHVLDVIRDQLSRRQPLDGGSRNLVRTMTVVCGYAEIRTLAAHRLEMWLQSPKLTRAAQDLLMSVCMNSDQQNCQQDVELTNLLSRIRLKTKTLISHYVLCMKELLGEKNENLHSLLVQTVYNELSTNRNPNNLTLISLVFHQASEVASQLLAEIFLDCLMNRDDYLRLLRSLLREVVRAVKQDFNFGTFTFGLLQERTSKFRDLDPLIKDRYLLSVVDLVSLTMLLCVSPAVREAASAMARVDVKDMEILRGFQKQIMFIQRDIIHWLHMTIVKMMGTIKSSDYMHCIKKALFIEKAEHYCKCDGWPAENERSVLLKLVSEVPVMEDSLVRILLMGLNRDLHLSTLEILDLTEILVKRAASLYLEDFPVLKVDRLEFVEAILNLCSYKHPENTVLPKGYQPPALAVSSFYWKAWTILLIICAFNPSSIGLKAWNSYPTLKCLMEMAMTNNFKFPPPTMTSDEKMADDIRNRERQMAEYVKQQTLEFECHLASSTITESNSRLVSQVTRMEPEGYLLRPPQPVLEIVKSLNQTLRIGPLLCQSRDPADFLLNIIQRQGASQSMPWLKDLVEANDSSLEVLPVQCLCEFLLLDLLQDDKTEDDGRTDLKKKQKHLKQEQLLARLQNLVHSTSSDPKVIELIIQALVYFLKRLGSPQGASRKQAIKGLSMVLSKNVATDLDDCAMETDELSPMAAILPGHVWLLDQLPALHHFEAVKMEACLALRSACQGETNATSVSAYIIFLSQHTKNFDLHELDDLAVDLAQLIVERSTLINHLLPQEGIKASPCSNAVLSAMISLFCSYLQKAQQPQNEAYSWSNTQDQILLQWTSGKSATMNILVVHAMIILLTYGSPSGESLFNDLLDAWFPETGSPPSAYLVDTSEEALLLPDWLKLRMIRSTISRLIDAALLDLEPQQLLLFVQSFGIPVGSMSKLLLCLDQAVQTDSDEMESAVVDKSYMAQLIEVQHMRGATGGDQFYKLLVDVQVQPKPEKEEECLRIIPTMNSASQLRRTLEIVPQQANSVAHITDMLSKIFDLANPSIDSSERQNMSRSLQRSVQNPVTAGVVVKSFLLLLKSPSGAAFIAGLIQRVHCSCPLLRVLTTSQIPEFREVADLLHRGTQGSRNPVSALISGYLAKQPNRSASMVQVKQPNKELEKQDQVKKLEKVLNDLCIGKTSSDSEQLLFDSMKEFIAGGEADRNVASDLLYRNLAGGLNCKTKNSGLLIDWIERLNPEVVNPNQMRLEFLFGKQHKKSSESRNLLYVLALMVHRCGWSNLRLAIKQLLSSRDNVQKYDAGTVLDFLWASIHIPSLWQGRDKQTSRYYVMEDVLGLSTTQLPVVVGFMIAEARENKDSKSLETLLSHRNDLLLAACCNKRHLLQTVIDHLQADVKNNRDSDGLCHHLLLDMYLRIPQIVAKSGAGPLVVHKLPPSSHQDVCNLSLLTKQDFGTLIWPEYLDIVSHRLINSLASAAPGKQAENRMLNSNIACRKLASEHPELVLRQLPMISALLQGRAQYSYGEMKSRNYILLYTHVLGLLELLQPFVFRPVYTAAFADLLQSYMELIMFHGIRNKSLGGLVKKFLLLLQSFVNFDQVRAVGLLHKYIPVFNDLSRQYTELAVLGSLLASLTLPVQENTDNSQAPPSSVESSLAPPRSSSPWTSNQLALLQQRTKKGNNSSDIIDALRELDDLSKIRVETLEHFTGNIQQLMLDRNTVCRDVAHSFMMRLIRYDPRYAKEFRQTVIKCLESRNMEVVNATLLNLREFVMLAQEFGPELLEKTFKIGIMSKVDTGSYISETLKMLNLEIS